jgi:general secretion pathway protein E
MQATLIGVLGQRLVRKICVHCKETFEMDASELAAMGLDLGKSNKVELSRGKGCLKCRGTGYLGRSGIYEVLPFTENMKRATTAETDLEVLRAQARKEGMITLRENAIKKLLEGHTTYQEVLRVTWEQM